jgi:hypothetical protein
MPIFASNEQLYKKVEEATRGMVGFNSAGIAGVIALTGKGASMPASLRVAGIVFLIGIFASVASWIFSAGGVPKGLNEDWVERDIKRTTIALYASAMAFLIGVVVLFFSV